LPRGAPRVFLHGRIDLLARRNGSYVVRDYKYARPTGAAVESYAAQLAAYRLAVLAAGGEQVEAELAFLRGGTVLRALPALDAAAEEVTLLRTATELGQSIASGAIEAFPRLPTDPAACTALGCGYVRRCWGGEEGRHGAGSDTAAS